MLLFLLCFLLVVVPPCAASEIHGGTMLAMKGRDSVVLAADSRFTSYRTGTFLLGQYPRPLFRVGERCLVGCIGLDSDARQLLADVRDRVQDQAHLEPASVARVVSNALYRRRLMLSPMVCGMDTSSGPYICSMDGLGAQTESAFAVCGTANAGLYAICESLYEPGLGADELCAVMGRCLSLALQRDVLSGCGVDVHVLYADGRLERRRLDTFDV